MGMDVFVCMDMCLGLCECGYVFGVCVCMYVCMCVCVRYIYPGNHPPPHHHRPPDVVKVRVPAVRSVLIVGGAAGRFVGAPWRAIRRQDRIIDGSGAGQNLRGEERTFRSF